MLITPKITTRTDPLPGHSPTALYPSQQLTPPRVPAPVDQRCQRSPAARRAGVAQHGRSAEQSLQQHDRRPGLRRRDDAQLQGGQGHTPGARPSHVRTGGGGGSAGGGTGEGEFVVVCGVP